MSTPVRLEPEVLSPCRNVLEVERLLLKYPLVLDRYDYGTAGFRYPAHVLEPVLVRVGLAVASLFEEVESESSSSAAHESSCSVGVMVTASHNTEEYNGVKIAASTGGMLSSVGESRAAQVVNASLDEAVAVARRISSQQRYPFLRVHVGCDTRESSPALCSLLVRTLRALGGEVVHHGVVTTPQLHHCVLHDNYAANCANRTIARLIPHSPNVRGYLALLSKSYLTLLQTKEGVPSSSDAAHVSAPSRTLVVDCACGVGHPHLMRLCQRLLPVGCGDGPGISSPFLCARFVATNAPGAGPLNVECGSEHVQKAQRAPAWYDWPEALPASNDESTGVPYGASLDGDADRIVVFRSTPDGSLLGLLDGDKITCLCCGFLQAQLSMLQSDEALRHLSLPSLGVVQTAYANGASTAYLQGVIGPERVKWAKTGVKHLHAVAHASFDVGVYFESNGHGTVLFGPGFYEFMEQVRELMDFQVSTAATVAYQRLAVLPSLVNQAVGDALSDLLLIDAILCLQDWTLDDWMGLYSDLPSRQVKVQVADRSVIVTNDSETRCLAPAGVQDELEAAMKLHGGRTFVRPSGTEDVVRIYAEAPTPAQADALAEAAVEIVQRLCCGIDADAGSPYPPSSKM